MALVRNQANVKSNIKRVQRMIVENGPWVESFRLKKEVRNPNFECLSEELWIVLVIKCVSEDESTAFPTCFNRYAFPLKLRI